MFVDAATGAVVDAYDEVREGTGNGYYNGNVTINTSGSGSSFSMTDTTRPGLRCGGQNGAAYTGTDDAWGNGSGTNLETACVDALYGAQREMDMLRGLARPQRHQRQRRRPADPGRPQRRQRVLERQLHQLRPQPGQHPPGHPDRRGGHEFGHAIFQTTPGGAGSGNENGGINEATGDIFGALTEAYANNPNDPPDYQVGEEVNLVGDGPIRYMYNPSLAGDPNCYSSSIPTTEVHAAAGPLNHWFYLVAEGSSPAAASRPARPATRPR